MPPPKVTSHERRILFEQCIAASSDIESFLRGWFHGAPIESLKRDNIMEWLAFVTTISDVFDKDEMEYYVKILEEKLDRSFEDGRNEHVRCMRPSLDEVEVVHRPLLWYLVRVVVRLAMHSRVADRATKIVMSLDFATYLALYYIGLRHYASPHWFSSFPFRPYSIFSRISGVPEISYWHREHISKRKQPLIYIHGIGVRVHSPPILTSFIIPCCTSLDRALALHLIFPRHHSSRSRCGHSCSGDPCHKCTLGLPHSTNDNGESFRWQRIFDPSRSPLGARSTRTCCQFVWHFSSLSITIRITSLCIRS